MPHGELLIFNFGIQPKFSLLLYKESKIFKIRCKFSISSHSLMIKQVDVIQYFDRK